MKFSQYSSIALLCLALQGSLTANQYMPEWSKNVFQKEDASVHYGPTTINNENLENLTIYGPAAINSSKITKMTIIKGPVEAKQSSFYELRIDGIANFDDVKVSKELFINGPVFARNSHLEDVSIASEKLALSNSTVKKLVVRKNDGGNKSQEVYLKKGSKVDSLIFEAKNGKVILGDSSSAVKNLEGGEIQKKS